jgi:phosphoglycolate phosphatase
MPLQAIIFDLDGTLIDSLSDIAIAANYALTTLHQPTHPRDAYRLMVGYGADVLFQKALPPAATHLVPQALDLYKEFYSRHPDDHAALFPGITDLLDTLARRGTPIAVLSNKPHVNTLLCVQQMLGRWPWHTVLGHRDNGPKKPQPDGALEIARALGLPPADIAFLGDSEPDMQTATAAGMLPLGALWGYRTPELLTACGARHLLHKPADLLPLLN